MQAVLTDFFAAYDIAPNAAIIAGVSGGPDSMALLHALHNHPAVSRVIAAHVNHRLNPTEAAAAQTLVTDYCRQHDIELYNKQIDVAAAAQAAKKGVEETGRRLRYQYFKQLLAETTAGYYATAHTADDNAETVLLHLLRGCGAAGLRGMAPVKDNHLRPLLTVTRAEIMDYLTQHNIPYVIDSSNASHEYTRNRVRHRLLPLLRAFNPRIDSALNRLAQAVSIDEQYLMQQAQNLVYTDGGGQQYCLKTELLAAPQALQIRALQLLYPFSHSLEAKHLLSMLDAVRRSTGCELPNGLRLQTRKGKVTVNQNPVVES